MVLVWRINDDSPNSPNFPAIWYKIQDRVSMHHTGNIMIYYCIKPLEYT